MIHALIRKIVFFGEGRIEVEYAFSDEMKELVELAESRKGEVSCVQKMAVS